MVNPPPFTLPVNVAVPPVFVILTVPVDVKEGMDWFPFPVNRTAADPSEKVPE